MHYLMPLHHDDRLVGVMLERPPWVQEVPGYILGMVLPNTLTIEVMAVSSLPLRDAGLALRLTG